MHDFVSQALGDSRSIVTARDGVEALEIFKKEWESIGLVLLDLGMPEMSGYEMLVEMLIIDPDVQVVVITGMDPDQNRLSGAQRILTKPLAADRLVAVVEELLGD